MALPRGRAAAATVFGLLLLPAGAATLHVSSSGLNAPPFANWADAATNLQIAVDAAGIGDTVLVTNGNYAPFMGFRNLLMTSSNAPAPVVVTASSIWAAGFEGWRAFSTNGFWAMPSNMPQWLVYDSGAPGGVQLDSYQMLCPNRPAGSGDQSLSDWQIQVSDDGLGWATIDTRSERLDENQHYFFRTAQPATARYVRVWVTGLREPAYGGTLRLLFGPSIVVTSVHGAAATVIDSGGQPGVWLGPAQLNGFQVVNAQAYGVFQGDVRNCIMMNVAGTGVSWARSADGCRIVGSSEYGAANVTVLRNSTLENNSLGGALNSPLVEGCLIRGNGATAASGGGVILSGLVGPAGVVSACFIVSNQATWGAGVYMTSGTVQNCFISENRAGTEGGGVYSLYGRVLNSTVVGNSADVGGGCIWVTVQNSILFGNTARTRGSNYVYNSSIAYSCAQPLSAGIGNFADDPRLLFLGSPRVASDSPCIDAGSDALTPGDWDIDGEPRIWGGGADVGCDEWYPPGLTGVLSVALSANFNRAVVGYPVRFQHAVWGKAEGFRLDFGDGQVVSNQLAIVHPFGAPGLFNAVLTGWNQDGSASATTTVQVFGGYTNYVSLAGGHDSPYTNWPAAATTLQDAVAANIPGGVIVAADGVYEQGGVLAVGGLTNRVALTNGVTLRSLNGPAAAVVKGAGPAGNAAVRCAYVGPDSRLEGFMLTNGHTRTMGLESETHGGGVLADGSGLISNCVIAGNAAAAGGGGGRGGAYWNCAFSGNTAANGGGVLGGVLENCRVLANNVSSNGGGALGGSLRNCLVADNSARYGGGTAWATNTHVTIARNSAGLYGGGVYRSFAVNSIISGNSASNGWPEFLNSVCDYSCTQPDPAGTGNITNDPQFADFSGGDFRLADGSACVDAGQDGHAGSDLAGVPRPLDGNGDSSAAPDMGAYERVGATADTDTDGLSDSNELYDVGTSPVRADTDGDEQADGGEIVGGTDPLDMDSYFFITRVRPAAANGPAFYWPGVAGRLYTIVGTTSLEQEWSNFPAYVDQPGFDGTMGFTNTAPAEFDFYGVRVRMAP